VFKLKGTHTKSLKIYEFHEILLEM
jgi:hypothetical protein